MRQVELGPLTVPQYLSEERQQIFDYQRSLELPHQIIEVWEQTGTLSEHETHLLGIFDQAERAACVEPDFQADERFLLTILDECLAEQLTPSELLLVRSAIAQTPYRVELIAGFHLVMRTAFSDEKGEIIPALSPSGLSLFYRAQQATSGRSFINELLMSHLEKPTQEEVAKLQRNIRDVLLRVLSNRRLKTQWPLTPPETALLGLLKIENQYELLQSVERFIHEWGQDNFVQLDDKEDMITYRWVWRKERFMETLYELFSQALLGKLSIDGEFPPEPFDLDKMMAQVKGLRISSVYHQLVNQQSKIE